MLWHCHELFHRMPPGAAAGGIAIVIDVLRASTTMISALAGGAVAVIPEATVDAARRRAAAIGRAAVLGGERGGVRIDGFDLGNSPAEYTADRVADRSVVLTTTNGTAALAACSAAREVLVGAFVNRTAVATAARRLAVLHGGDVHLVCAGTGGVVTDEDVLAAGAILDAASADPASTGDRLDDAAILARDRFRRLVATHPANATAGLVDAFARSPGGANLVELGMADDLARCARIDTVCVVPRLDRSDGCLRAEA